MKKKTVFKKALSAVLVLMMLLGTLLSLPMTASAASVWNGTTQTKPAGSGTEADPYRISSGAELAYVSTNIAALCPASGIVYLELTNDIHMGAHNIKPINALEMAVKFYGNGHTISHLKIESASDHVGLFSYAGNGTAIYDLHLTNATIATTGADAKAAGFIANANGNLTMYNCSVDGTISGTLYVGGMVGGVAKMMESPDWTFQYCVNKADLTADATEQIRGVGGIMGYIHTLYAKNITLDYCANTGNIVAHTTATAAGGNSAGGLIGGTASSNPRPYEATLKVSNCYSSGNITTDMPDTIIGGIHGRLHLGHTAVFRNVYVTGTHTATQASTSCGIITGWGASIELTKNFINAYGLVSSIHSTGNTKAMILTANGNKTAGKAVHVVGGSNFADMYNSDGVTSADEEIALCKYDAESGRYVYDRTSTVNAEIARIAGVIENLPDLDISSAAKNLRVRIKLTDPFGFMVITSMSVKGSTLPYADYQTAVDSYGFIFLNSDTEVTVNDILSSDKQVKVSGAQYGNTNYFYAVYNKVTASDLDQDVYFVAYAEIDGQLVTSDVRVLNPYNLVDDATDGAIGTNAIPNPFEVKLYVKMKEYHLAFKALQGGQEETPEGPTQFETMFSKENEILLAQVLNNVQSGNVQKNLPTVLSFNKTLTAGDGAYTFIRESATLANYTTYCNALKTNGFAQYTKSEFNGSTAETKNYFATFVSPVAQVDVGYHAYLDRLYVTATPRTSSVLPLREAPAYTSAGASYPTILTQAGMEEFGNAESSMGYIVRLADGSFVIVDSGESIAGVEDRIYNVLRKQAPDPSNITISAWILTHAHADHVGGFIRFVDKYAGVNIRQVVYNFPDNSIASGAASMQKSVVTAIQKLGSDVEILKPHTGNVLYYADVAFRILYTQENYLALANDFANNYNCASIVMQMVTADGTKVLFGADHPVAGDPANIYCGGDIYTYGTFLQSYVCTTFHHGNGGGADDKANNIYATIAPKVVLWCVDQARLDKDNLITFDRNAYFTTSGVKYYVAGDNVQIVRFANGKATVTAYDTFSAYSQS